MIHRRHLKIDGLYFSYLEKGSPVDGKPSLVLLHGLMGCAATFAPLMADLEDDVHIVALDFPGAGESERAGFIDASLAGTARHVARFLSALGLERPMLLGHSHGGAVATCLAADRAAGGPDLHSLVLLAPAHPYFEESDPVVRFYLSLPGRLFAHTMPWFPRWMQLIGLRRMAGPKSWDEPERLVPYRDNLRTPGTMAHLLKLLRSWHVDMAGLGRLLRRPLAVPTMLIWGDADRAVPHSSAARLRERIHSSELHVLPGIGHRPAEEVPDVVARLVEDWVRRDAAVLAPLPAYSPNSSATQPRIAPFITSSFEAGD